MQYHVVYTTPDHRRWRAQVEAPNDADALRDALTIMPPAAALEEITEIDIPMAA